MLMKRLFFPFFLLLQVVGCATQQPTATPAEVQETAEIEETAAPPATKYVPEWAQGAVFYQIFPERFRNGDPTNDPTRASLETPIEGRVPESWEVTPWTQNWYERADWEKQRGEDFYEDGVFDRRYGGDLQGVIDKLGYLDSLGVDALYFNPVFWARSLHKYDGNTFHHIDPHFGPDPEGDFALMEQEDPADPSTWKVTAADALFFELLDKAHARGMKVVIDGVFNHTGRDFFAFDSIRREQEDSPYVEWYNVRAFDDPATPDTSEFDYEGWWGVETLPVFADNAAGDDLHPGPKQYVFDATERWMDPNGDGDPSDGIDGWRLDVAEEVPLGFWADWNAHVRRLNDDAYTVTEVWEDAAAFIEEGNFSSTMNYFGFAFPTKGFLIDGALEPPAFAELLNERRTGYPVPVRHALQNLIDSHDTPRLASMIVNRSGDYVKPERFDYDWGEVSTPRGGNRAYDVSAPGMRGRQLQRLTALFQMTYLGAPMIYYGTEAGMWGADDPDDRKPMVWPDLDYEPETEDPLGRPREADPVRFDHDLYDFYRRVIALREDYPAIREGAFEVLLADAERDLFAFRRSLRGEHAVVVLNRSGQAHSVRVPLPADARRPMDLVFSTTERSQRVQQDGEALLLEVPAREGLVLHPGEAK